MGADPDGLWLQPKSLAQKAVGDHAMPADGGRLDLPLVAEKDLALSHIDAPVRLLPEGG